MLSATITLAMQDRRILMEENQVHMPPLCRQMTEKASILMALEINPAKIGP